MNLYKYIDYLDVNNCEIIYDLLGESLRPLGDIVMNVIKMDLSDDQLKRSLYLDGVNIPRKLALLKYILTYHSSNYTFLYRDYLKIINDQLLIEIIEKDKHAYEERKELAAR